MHSMKSKLILREKIILVIAVIFLFQAPLLDKISVFQYYDELVCMFFALYFILNFIKINIKFLKVEVICIFASLTLVVIGLAGNYINGIQTNLSPILTDIGNNFKFLLLYFSVIFYMRNLPNREYLIHCLATVVKITVVIASFFAVINFFIDINMSYDVRFGLRSYQFIYGHAGTLNIACYMYLMILSADLINEKKKGKTKFRYLVLTLFIWCCTLRSRSFILALMYIFLAWFLINRKTVKARYIIASFPILSISAYIAFPQIERYFINSDAPRSILLRYGIKTMTRFFPIGSGFATYGTFAASKYYSKLYYEYGFTSGYGINYYDRQFLTDNYWPAIIGQFGVIGAILMVIILVCVFKSICMHTKKPELKLASLLGFLSILISSAVTSSFANFPTVGIFFLIPIFFDKSTNEQMS